MAALESLKSLTAKSPSIWADMYLVPWENIAIALASVSKEASMYGRLKYAMEDRWRQPLLAVLYARSLTRSWNKTNSHKKRVGPRGKFKIDWINKRTMLLLANMALEESVSPGICPRCKGRGTLKIKDTLLNCKVCNGIGRRSSSDSSRARYLGISLYIFSYSIKRIYFNEILSITNEWEHELIKALKRA